MVVNNSTVGHTVRTWRLSSSSSPQPSPTNDSSRWWQRPICRLCSPLSPTNVQLPNCLARSCSSIVRQAPRAAGWLDGRSTIAGAGHRCSRPDRFARRRVAGRPKADRGRGAADHVVDDVDRGIRRLPGAAARGARRSSDRSESTVVDRCRRCPRSSPAGSPCSAPGCRASWLPIACDRRASMWSSTRRTPTSAAHGCRTPIPVAESMSPATCICYSFAERDDWPQHFSRSSPSFSDTSGSSPLTTACFHSFVSRPPWRPSPLTTNR